MGNKGDNTRELIKEASYRLFVENGFKEVTMKDICEETGLSRGGLYRHYASTADIFEEIWSGLLVNLWIELEKSMEEQKDAREILRKLLERRKAEIEDKERTLTLSIYEYSHAISNHLFIEINRRSKDMWSRFLKYGIERNEFSNVNVEEMVDLILYSYQGARMWSTILPMETGVSKHLTDFIWNTLIPSERRN